MTLPAPGLGHLTQSFAMILGGLCDAAAARMSKPTTRRQQAAYPLMLLLWSRLRRTIARFARLAANPEAVAPPRIRIEGEMQKPSEQQRLPSGFGWVVKLLPEAAVFGSQLQHFLTDPDMAALVAANPKIAGLLRPLCRMLAVPGPAKPAPVPATSAAPQPQSAPPDPGSGRPEPWPSSQPTGSTEPPSPAPKGSDILRQT